MVHTKPKFLPPNIFLWFVIPLLLCLSTLTHSQSILDGTQSNNTSSNLLGGGDEFLPVTEAFRLEARLHEGQLVLNWEIQPDYYLYHSRFKLSAEPMPADFEPEFSTNTIEKYDEYFEKDMDVYYGNARVTLNVPQDAEPFTLRVESQGCADAGLCYPPHIEYLKVDPSADSIEITEAAAPASSSGGPSTNNTAEDLPTQWLPLVLLLALLGGIILNLMPCVFPVLSIKVMGLAQADRERLPLHGWAYTAGILVCFLIFGAVLLLARAGGEAIGWGFQLQSPLLIAALAYLFFVLGLSLSGLLPLGTRWMGVGQNLTQHSGLTGSFFTGVLAAVVASPCTAPFMGAALGFALTQPTIISLSVFAALGLGMALPLLLLCYLPALVRHLPKPGAWMETLKQLLAFPLYLTAIWLLWVLGRQAGINAVAALCAGALAIAFAGWLVTREARSNKARAAKTIMVVLAWATAVILPWQNIGDSEDPGRWEPYSAQRLTALRERGEPVFINLTADWCITCLANERLTLGTEAVEAAFERNNVALLKGDWTNQDSTITDLLENYGRSGVPLYLWFPANHSGPGIVLPQILRRGDLLRAIEPQKADNI